MQLHYEIDGTGPDIVLLTGLAGSTRYWDHLVSGFDQQGYRVVRLDLLGFGRSPKPKKCDYSIKDHSEAIVATLETIGVTHCILVGYSSSCSLTLHIAAQYPDLVSRAVLVCPTIYSSLEVSHDKAYATGDTPRWLLEGPLSRAICTIICTNPYIALPMYRLFVRAKNIPKIVRDEARLHTYRSYRRTLDSIVINYSPFTDLKLLMRPLTALYGDKDDSLDIDFLTSLPLRNSHISLSLVLGGHHQLPNQYPQRVIEQIVKPY